MYHNLYMEYKSGGAKRPMRCQFQFTTLGWLKLVSDDILKTG